MKWLRENIPFICTSDCMECEFYENRGTYWVLRNLRSEERVYGARWRLLLYPVYYYLVLTSSSCRGFKKRAPRAIKEVRRFAKNHMGTEDVRVDTKLNKFLWSKGIR